MAELSWSERINIISVNASAASMADILRMAADLQHAKGREEMIRKVCETLLHEHNEMRKFVIGFGYKKGFDDCDCEGCEAARKFLEDSL